MIKKLSYRVHAVNIVSAYIVGLIVGNFLLMPLTGVLAFAFIVGGAIIALPLLAITLLIVPFINKSLENNLKNWCVVSTVIVTVSWLILEYVTNYSNRFDVAGYLSIRNVWERAFLAFLCSSISATFYYFRTKSAFRKGERNEW